MLSWADLQRSVGARWPVARTTATTLGLVHELHGRRQTVVVAPADGSRPAVAVVVEVCRHLAE